MTPAYDGHCYSVAEYRQMVLDSELKPRRVIAHHTASPTLANWLKWGGAHYMKTMRDYYDRKGWDCYPHCFCAPEGIWIMSPLGGLNRGAGWSSIEDINVEIVGNFTAALPDGPVLYNALGCLTALLHKSGWGLGALVKHRDFNPDTECPGNMLVRNWYWFIEYVWMASAGVI